MSDGLARMVAYWSAGGWLGLPIAAVSFGIWFYFLRARHQLLAVLRDPAPAVGSGDPDGRILEDVLSRDFAVLAAWTAAAPLLGLTGTVAGMVRTFDAVRQVSGDTGAQVAEGISQALITTQAGLVVAIPGLFGLARLRRLFGRVQTRMVATRLHARTPGPEAGP